MFFTILPATLLPRGDGRDTMTTIACVLITHLRYKAEVQRFPQLKNRPLLITGA